MFVYVVEGQGTIRGGACSVYVSTCARARNSRGRERERDRRAVEKRRSPSCVRVKISNDRTVCFFFLFNFNLTTTATITPLSGDRATRLVLGSCPYHGTSHGALSLRRRALPMAASGSESTPAVA